MAVRRVLRLCGRSNGMRGEGGGGRPPSMSAQGGGKPRASRSERGGGPRNGSAAAPVFAPVLELDTRLVVIIPLVHAAPAATAMHFCRLIVVFGVALGRRLTTN